MKADIQTFNCLGQPIEIQIRGKRNPKYRKTTGEYAGRAPDTYGTNKAELFGAADLYRRNPNYFAPAEPGEDVEGMCEWAFVIEQLVAEGTL